MSQIEITASFAGEPEAQEAMRKLQALRALEVTGLEESGVITATVDQAVADRAMRLIEQIGGQAQTTIL